MGLHPKHSEKPDPDQPGDLLQKRETLMPCPGAAAMTRTPFSLHIVSGAIAKIGEGSIRGPDFLQPQFADLLTLYPRCASVSQMCLGIPDVPGACERGVVHGLAPPQLIVRSGGQIY